MAESSDVNNLAHATTFVWHEVYGASSSASTDFYTQALDWGVTEMPMGDSYTYKMFTVGGTPVAGCLGTTEHPELTDVPAHWATYIGVDDVDARTEKCVALGATVLVPAMDIPTVGRMCLIQDPQGATFWLFKGDSA